jgi:predicted DNA-binding transcriptional regulator AlpA
LFTEDVKTDAAAYGREVMSREVWSPAELAERLGVSVGTLANWRWRGEGPRYVKLGSGRSSRVRYRAEDVAAWETRHAAGGDVAA